MSGQLEIQLEDGHTRVELFIFKRLQEGLIERFDDVYAACQKEFQRSQKDRKEIQSKLLQVNRKLSNLVESLKDCPSATIKSEILKLEAEKAQLEQLLNQKNELSQERLQETISELGTLLKENKQQAREVMHLLIERINVTPAGEDEVDLSIYADPLLASESVHTVIGGGRI